MKKILTALIIFAVSKASYANMTNTDFSQGITGWELSGNVLINGSTVSVGGGCGANVNCYISQTFIANAGDTLSGNVQWFGGDYMPFNDYGSLLLIDNTNSTTSTIFYGDVNTYGNFGHGKFVLHPSHRQAVAQEFFVIFR